MNRKKFVAINNIPTPYRIHFFALLNKELEKRGWDFEVWYLAKTEMWRYWRFQPEDFQFPHMFGRGIHPYLKGSHFHINPDLIYKSWQTPADVILICGGWFIPTIVASTVLSKLRYTPRVYMWAESNLQSMQHSQGPVSFIRSKIFNAYDGFVIPGIKAKSYLETTFPNYQGKTLIYLPNVVNEELFHDQVSLLRKQRGSLRQELQIAHNKRVLITLSRLIPIKGIMEMLMGVAQLNETKQERLLLLVAGDGQQRDEIEEFIQNQHLNECVRLLGNLEEAAVIRYLALADGFILPSIKDPSPLSAIEAAFAGLPLLLSSNVGNHPELLTHEENGWLFEPRQINSIQQVLELFLEADEAELDRMGINSCQVANNHFHTKVVVPRFVKELLT